MQILPHNSKIPRKKLWILLLLGIGIVATILLAAGLSQLELRPGRPFPLAGILQMLRNTTMFLSNLSLPVDVIRMLIACIWILLFISIIGFIVSPEVRKNVFKRTIIYLIWILLIYGLATTINPYLPRFGQEESETSGATLFDATDSTEALPATPDFIVNPPQWFVVGVSAFLVALLLGIIWFFWHLFSAGEKETPLELLSKEAQQALTGLQAGQDLKDTIMRCYFEMSQILSQQQNLHRRSGMTPREFERYLAESGLHIERIQRLTRLFEDVRYGGKPSGRRQEQEAIACLTTIVQTYGRSS